MASLTMTPLDGQRPNKRFRRCTTGDPPSSRTDLVRARPTRSSSTSSYAHASRRHSSATTVCSNSLTHSSCSHPHSRTPSISHSPIFTPSASRSRSAAEARALVLDPAYTGAGPAQARVYVDELGVAHDPDYRMFPAVPSSPRLCSGTGVRRGSVTSARGRFTNGSVGGRSESPFTGSPFAGYADFELHYSNTASREVDSDDDDATGMDLDEDADAESVIEWSRVHASARPLGYGEGKVAEKDDGYAEFVGMDWDEREWRREEAPSLDRHSPPTSTSTDVKKSTPPTPSTLVPSASAASLPRTYPKPATAKIRVKHKSHSRAGSDSSNTRGCVPAKRSYDESMKNEWVPSCGYSVRRHWHSFTLRIRFTVFRWRRTLRRAFVGTTGD